MRYQGHRLVGDRGEARAVDLVHVLHRAEHARFWGAIAGRYDPAVDQLLGAGVRGRIAERLVREGALGRAVELGCGTKFFTGILAAHARSVVATDVAEGMLGMARRQITAPNVSFQVEDCQRTSFPDGAFDAALLALVLHFTDPQRTLTEMARILRPGGTVIVANFDPGALPWLRNVQTYLRVLLVGITKWRRRPPPAFGKNVIGAVRLEELLRECGFDVGAADALRPRLFLVLFGRGGYERSASTRKKPTSIPASNAARPRWW